MEKLLQSLRIGTINLFGITVPGFLIVFFLFVGLVNPILSVAFLFTNLQWADIFSFYKHNATSTVVFLLVVSYVIGYILRLSSPDELDKISAKKVLKKLEKNEPEEIEHWPFTGDKNDKFPYFNFRKYLESRSLNKLLKHVNWGKGKKRSKRSKAIINIMKLDILHYCPDLYSIVESNEAHIRLMSGTWLAIKNTIVLVIIGSIISLTTAYYISSQMYYANGKILLSYHSICSIILIFMCCIMFWAKKRIENLFHYRRVSELLFIVQSAHIARTNIKK